MVDPISSASLIIAIIAGVNSVINSLHLKKVKCGMCQSECTKTPPNSPTPNFDIPQSNKKKGVSFEDEKHNEINI